MRIKRRIHDRPSRPMLIRLRFSIFFQGGKENAIECLESIAEISSFGLMNRIINLTCPVCGRPLLDAVDVEYGVTALAVPDCVLGTDLV